MERSLILKQARPWVEKYPQIAAPWDRALVEGRFYEVVAPVSAVANVMPKLLGVDKNSRIIALEDLGEARDFTALYRGESLTKPELQALINWLSLLHRFFTDSEFSAEFTNQEMRNLNYEHIFDLPLREENGLDLNAITPGLAAVASVLKTDKHYVNIVRELGSLYLTDGDTLLHGDFFPGSWLQTSAGIRVIDPEFCFFGSREFDLGVLIAHLYLAQQNPDLIKFTLQCYTQSFDEKLMWKFAGVEIMRRLIGVAQLPLRYGLLEKTKLLELSHEFVIGNQGS
jgi:5-methylthioribose kinase